MNEKNCDPFKLYRLLISHAFLLRSLFPSVSFDMKAKVDWRMRRKKVQKGIYFNGIVSKHTAHIDNTLYFFFIFRKHQGGSALLDYHTHQKRVTRSRTFLEIVGKLFAHNMKVALPSSMRTV